MSKIKYAMSKNGHFVRDWEPMRGEFKLTTDPDRAMLYTPSGIEEHLPFLEKHDIELVQIEVRRVATGIQRHATDVLNEVLAGLQAEFDELDQHDVDELSEADYRRWKRLRRQLTERTIDKSKIT